MIEQPVWLWYGDWNEQIIIIMFMYIGENKKSDSCLETHENLDHSSGDYCATLFNLVYYLLIYFSFFWCFIQFIVEIENMNFSSNLYLMKTNKSHTT